MCKWFVVILNVLYLNVFNLNVLNVLKCNFKCILFKCILNELKIFKIFSTVISKMTNINITTKHKSSLKSLILKNENCCSREHFKKDDKDL